MTDTFKTKATAIEAKKFNGSMADASSIQDWLGADVTVLFVANMTGAHPHLLNVNSGAAGTLVVETGSYLVRQDGAQLIAMKPAVFEAMFETAAPAGATVN